MERDQSPPPLPPLSSNAATNSGLRNHNLPSARTRPFPQSSPIQPSRAIKLAEQSPSSPIGSAQYSLRRSSSSLGRDSRSVTPTLKKKVSTSSIQGGAAGGPSSRPPSRRSSSAVFPSSPSSSRPRSSMGAFPEQPESPQVPTAESIAKQCFEKEVELHSQPFDGQNLGKTIIILQDACYGHRYSRPRTSKASLSTIVERPERIHATILGISAAYVRLGGRSSTSNLTFSPKRYTDQITSFPFRIQKSTRAVPLSSAAVTNVHGTEWMQELSIMCDSAASKLALNGKELVRPDAGTTSRTEPEKPKLHEGDLYLCKDSLDALEGCIGAVFDGVDRIFQGNKAVDNPPRAFVCIRPPGHHCSASYPSGFCWLNNVHVGINYAAMNYGLTHAAIIDFDLHHGDGSQAIAWDHNSRLSRLPKNAATHKKTSIGYFSIHDINSYPCEMGDEEKVKNASLCIENSHGQNIWNVHLQPWKHDIEFWELYEQKYLILLDKARAFLRTHAAKFASTPNAPPPKAAIFLSAGFDASEWEGAGMQRHKVNVPTEFYARFTSDVVRLSEEEGLAVDGRIISVLEGGYSNRALCSGVMSHISGLAGSTLAQPNDVEGQARLGKEMGNRIRNVNDITESFESLKLGPQAQYDSNWWALRKLEELEELVEPPPPQPAPRKPRTTVPPTYTTPTRSSTAKVVASPKLQRVTSTNGLPDSPRSASSRAASPPPPEVGWAMAAHELSKVLIPSDRQTKSHRPEDLSVEASRVKKEKPAPTASFQNEGDAAGGKRQLRDRRAKAPNYAFDGIAENKISRADRRRTVAVTDLAVNQPDLREQAAGIASRTRRRSSAASSVTYLPVEEEAMPAPPIHSISTVIGRPNSSGGVIPSNGSALQLKPAVVSSGVAAVRNPQVPPLQRTTSSKGRATKKQTSVSGSSRGTSRTRVPSDGDSNDPADSKSISPTGADGLEGIAASMKKMSIKLKVPSREEHDAREKKKIAEKKPTTRAPRKPAAPKVPRAAGPKKTALKPSTAASKPNASASSNGNGVALAPSTATNNLPQELKAPVAESSAQSTSDQSIADIAAPEPAPSLISHDSFIAYDAPQPAANPPIKQEPLVWLPPNTSTPQPTRQSNLPSFTSSSPIPFGQRADAGAFQPPPVQQLSGVAANTGNGPLGAEFSANREDAAKINRNDDVFKVPDSPVKHR